MASAAYILALGMKTAVEFVEFAIHMETEIPSLDPAVALKLVNILAIPTLDFAGTRTLENIVVLFPSLTPKNMQLEMMNAFALAM